MNAAQKAFCEAYVANGYIATRAYRIAYPNSSETSISGNSSRLLKNKEVRAYIAELERETYEQNRVNAEHIANELSAAAFQPVNNDEGKTWQIKLKALELLGKQLSLYTQKVEVEADTTINVNIVDE